MKLRSLLVAAAAILIAAPTMRADDFFDTSEADRPITFGARLGFNMSNQTSPSTGKQLNLDSWGSGFDAGVVCDLNIRNFIALQPGFFFESRSNNYSYLYNGSIVPGSDFTHEYGHTRHYTFKIPVLASLRLNPAEDLRWSVDFGPYLSFGLGGSDKGYIPTNPQMENGHDFTHYNDGYYDLHRRFDFGFKMGTGIQYAQRYYLGIHYEAGALNVWKGLSGGRHKAWMFTIGYDF